MTHETPEKVLSLLGAALVSMAFLFAVTISNASFTHVYNPPSDIFAPARVMAVLDNVSNSYSNFVYAQFVRPEAPEYAMAWDNLAFIGQGAAPQIASALGFENVGSQSMPQVAGASTEVIVSRYYPTSGGGPGMFSLLIGKSN